MTKRPFHLPRTTKLSHTLILILISVLLLTHPTYINALPSNKHQSSPPSPTNISTTTTTKPQRTNKPPPTPQVLIIDVDNTLYREASLGIEAQIISNTHTFASRYYSLTPRQCDDMYHKYGSTVEGLRRILLSQNHGTDDGDDDGDEKVKKMMSDFYQQVYDGIDLSPLTPSSSSSSSAGGVDTGYSVESAGSIQRRRAFLTSLFHSIPCPVYLASNSPRRHVDRVLSALGLKGVGFEGILTPDGDDDGGGGVSVGVGCYPTKKDPKRFYRNILNRYSVGEETRVVLLDDSRYNIERAGLIGFEGILIHNDDGGGDMSIEEAIAICLGHIDSGGRIIHPSPLTTTTPTSSSSVPSALRSSTPSPSSSSSSSSSYRFNDVKYLRSKNLIDIQSINPIVWKRLATELSQRLRRTTNNHNNNERGILRIVDVGAGLLSMLELVLMGGGGKPSLVELLSIVGKVKEGGEELGRMEYIAYEANRGLIGGCRETLARLGFMERATTGDGGDVKKKKEEEVDELIFDGSSRGLDVTVYLRLRDFQSEEEEKKKTHASPLPPPPPPHLIIGCCFADLFNPPEELITSLLHYIHYFSPTTTQSITTTTTTTVEPLVYFPITFSGTTQFLPPQPFGVSGSRLCIPSDTLAFHMYANALRHRHGHNLNPLRLVEAVEGVGGRLLGRGDSPWKIPWSDDDDDEDDDGAEDGMVEDGVGQTTERRGSYLWETMLYFLGMGVGGETITKGGGRGWGGWGCGGGGGWDVVGWLERARVNKPMIWVGNEDLLFVLPRVGCCLGDGMEEKEEVCHDGEIEGDGEKLMVEKIMFTAPDTVGMVEEEWDTSDGLHLGPGEVEVESICSLISSGTELKIFKGTFKSTAALDVNIPGLSDTTMSYPLTYGYSSVGRITRCHPSIPNAPTLLNRLVFTFSPHASHHIVNIDDIQFVPDGIEPEDAIFLPAVETALSIVHDAQVRLGEEVVVMGQGLIGLLVTRLLTRSSSSVPVTTVDTIPSRLAASSSMGGSIQCILPPSVSSAGPFDVAIEVSGNPRALQSSIDSTRDGGRVIIASWYGDDDDEGVRLKLGIEFHRSHKTIRTSQVSTIPADLSGLWDKKRRFDLTWDLVREIQPGKALIGRRVRLEDAQNAYECLERGEEIAVVFVY